MFLKYFRHSKTLAEIDYTTMTAKALYYRRDMSRLTDRDLAFMSRLISTYFNQLPDENASVPIGYVYILKSIQGCYLGAHKIGRTSAHPYRRIKQLSETHKCKIDPVWIIRCPSNSISLNLEQTLHHHFQDIHIDREWFSLSDTDLDNIRELPGGIDLSGGKRPQLAYYKFYQGMKVTA